MAKKLILSIDGGGIKGILPLHALIELEQQTGKQAKDIFSLMAGTSTGALIISGLAVGIPARDILNWYIVDGRKVFHGGWGVQFLEDLEDRIPGSSEFLEILARWGGHKYDTEPLYDYVSEKIGAAAGGRPGITLNEVKQDFGVDLLITAKGVVDNYSWFFVPDNPVNHDPGCPSVGELPLVDCATASAAAPTYFAPWDMNHAVGKDNRLIGPCVDGGVGTAGNPSYQACVEAFYYSPPGAYQQDQTILVSLGTGRAERMASVPSNLLNWANWTIGALLSAPAQQQLQLVSRHFPKTSLYRVDVLMEKDIDMADWRSIAKLEDVGKGLAKQLQVPANNWATILADKPNIWRK